MKNFSKILMVALCATLFFSCSKENLSDNVEVESLNTKKKRDTDQVSFSVPCPTAMYAQGLAPGEVVVVESNFGVVTTFNTTDYTTLETNTSYTLDIPFGATVTICSCGENYDVLTSGPFGSQFVTSSDPTSYSMCAF